MEAINGLQQSPNWFLGANPLLEGVPEFQDRDTFIDRLAFSPISGLDVSALSFMERDTLLVCEKMPLEPTTQSIRAAMTWYGMFRGGLQARNPVLPEAKRQYWAALSSVDQNAFNLPRSPSGGISVQIVKGPTGTAKTVTVRRFCSMLGPQRIDRPANADAGWKAMRQLVYLYTSLSHDGSQGGFLIGILLEMDRALETNYAVDLPKRFKTVERLAVATIGRLLAHFAGIIFIDEGQLRNLMLSDQADLMQLFLLTLMNSGIPLVLVGNELAFDWIDYSQDLSRLNVVKREHFCPVGATDHPDAEADWDAQYAGISAYYVLPKPVEDPDACKRVLKQCSGGIGRLGLTLWCSSQRDRHFVGGESLRSSDILAAYHDEAFDALRPLADGFAKRLPELLLKYPDVAAEYYAERWGKPIGGVGAETDSNNSKGNFGGSQVKPTGSSKERQSGRSKLKAEQTRQTNRDQNREALAKTLSPEDMRSDGVKKFHLAGLDAARKKVEKDGKAT